MSEENKNDITNTYREVGPYLGLGSQLAVTIVALFFLGKWLDEKFELFPLLTISLSFLGGFAGIYNFIKTVLNMNKKKKNENNT